jgi:plasmid replication initiation protein
MVVFQETLTCRKNAMDKKKARAVQSNNLIESRYILTSSEQKLCLAMISKIQPDDIEFAGLEIKVSELAALIDINLKYAYFEIQKITKRLMGRVIHIPEETGWLLTHWVSSCRYHHEHGTVTLKFDENLKPYLLKLRKEFTKVDLEVVAQFQSIYAIRIYQLLKAFSGIGWREIGVVELKDMLGLKPGQYAEYRDFNKRVIAQAKKEMEAIDETGRPKSDLSFEVETIREERKITRLKFIIIKNKMKEMNKSKAGNIGKSLKTIADSAIKPQQIGRKFNFPEYWDEFLKYIEKEDPGLLPIIASDGPECMLVKVPYNKWSREFK